MRRSGPLERKTELRADPAKNRAWQNRSRSEMKRTEIKKVSDKKRKARPGQLAVRGAVFARDNWTCQMIGWRGECFGPPTYHHVKKASAGGKYTFENGLTACVRHNSLVETYPIEAWARGWVR